MDFTRRQVLKAGSAILALPWLETLALADEKAPPKRIITVCTSFGLYGPSFFPTKAGRDYEPSEYLEDPRRPARSVHRLLGHLASGHRRRSRFGSLLPHQRQAPDAARLPQHGVARLRRGPARRRGHALSADDALARRTAAR